MQKDASGNNYIDVSNIRLTYVPATSRETAKNWTGQDMIRVQAYRDKGALFQGAEFPAANVLGVIEALCRLRSDAESSGA